jgi:hypothetical protein
MKHLLSKNKVHLDAEHNQFVIYANSARVASFANNQLLLAIKRFLFFSNTSK